MIIVPVVAVVGTVVTVLTVLTVGVVAVVGDSVVNVVGVLVLSTTPNTKQATQYRDIQQSIKKSLKMKASKLSTHIGKNRNQGIFINNYNKCTKFSLTLFVRNVSCAIKR